MRVLIFGTGVYYERWKARIRKDLEIVAFLDNNECIQGTMLDDKPILSPQIIGDIEYDFIFLLSAYYIEMRKQLRELGVSDDSIYDVNQIEKLCECEPARYYGTISKQSRNKKILVFSHALSSSGAQNVMFIALCELKKIGYDLIVISKTDGILRERFLERNIPVIIMQDLRWDNPQLIELMNWADEILVNTLWLYYIVNEMAVYGKRIVWWVHEMWSTEGQI